MKEKLTLILDYVNRLSNNRALIYNIHRSIGKNIEQTFLIQTS